MNIEQILRNPQRRVQKSEKDEDTGAFFHKSKARCITEGNEAGANHWATLYFIYTAQNNYIHFFELISQKKYYAAWCLLERIEISIKNILHLYTFVGDEYKLLFIQTYVRKLQSLFPYTHFGSSEYVKKEVRCSICDNIVSLRKRCGHQKGELYMGELCHHIITLSEFIGISLVTEPFNKYSVMGVTNEHDPYKYPALDFLLTIIDHPFNEWDVEKYKMLEPHEKFRTGRNERCPCLSDKKYKHCCLPRAGVEMDHIDIVLKQPTMKSRGMKPTRKLKANPQRELVQYDEDS
jgi:hypothetical protein